MPLLFLSILETILFSFVCNSRCGIFIPDYICPSFYLDCIEGSVIDFEWQPSVDRAWKQKTKKHLKTVKIKSEKVDLPIQIHVPSM